MVAASLTANFAEWEAETLVPAVSIFTTDELGLASGRTNVIHAALIQGGAALKFLAAASRLERYRKGSAAFADPEWIGYGQRMSETNETEGKAARGGSKMTLNVRRTVESGHVRQSFSHGRSKSVLVEKKKRRAIGSTPGPAAGRGRNAETEAASRRRGHPEVQGRGDRSASPQGSGAAPALRRGEGCAQPGVVRCPPARRR